MFEFIFFNYLFLFLCLFKKTTIRNIFDKHIYQLVLQDVRDNVLDSSWASILIRLAWNVCQTVHFDLRSTGLRYFQFNRQQKQQSQSNNETVKSNDVQKSVMNSNTVHKQQVYSPMDIRYYVHIKKVRPNLLTIYFK